MGAVRDRKVEGENISIKIYAIVLFESLKNGRSCLAIQNEYEGIGQYRW